MTIIYSRLSDGSTNPAWLEARRGKITASQLHRVMGTALVRGTYLTELLVERITGQLLEHGSNTDAMQQGIDREDEAGERYAQETGATLVPGYWMWSDKLGFGATPDFLIDGGGGVDVKCPQPKGEIQARFAEALGGKWRSAHEYYWQCIGNAVVVDEPWWDLAVYCRELAAVDLDLHTVRHRNGPEIAGRVVDAVFEANALLTAQFDLAMHAKRRWVESVLIPRIREATSHEAVQECENEVYRLGKGVLPPALIKAIDAAILAKTATLPNPLMG